MGLVVAHDGDIVHRLAVIEQQRDDGDALTDGIFQVVCGSCVVFRRIALVQFLEERLEAAGEGTALKSLGFS